MIKVTHIMYLSEKSDQNPFSGAENHIVTLVCGLAKKGVDIELVVLLWNDGKVIQARLDEIRNAGVRVTTIDRPGEGFMKTRLVRAGITWNRLRKYLKTLEGRMVHIHLDLVIVPVLVKLTGIKKSVISIHNDEPCYKKRRWRFWLKFIDGWISRYIAITNHVASYYRETVNISEEKIERIYYGVEEPGCVVKDFIEYGIPENTIKIGFVGRLTEQKNLFTFLKAIKEIEGVSLILIGDGGLREDLKKYADDNNIKNAYFIGSVPDAASLMCNFDIFCMPSLWEGLGLVFIEAMLSKTPVIGSDAGAIPEVLAKGKYGVIVNPGSYIELRDAIIRSVDNIDKLKENAINAFHYAKRQFSVDTMVGETIAFYETVIQNHGE